jgi:hypothetical protein
MRRLEIPQHSPGLYCAQGQSIRMTWTTLPITSAFRFWPWGPLGMGAHQIDNDKKYYEDAAYYGGKYRCHSLSGIRWQCVYLPSQSLLAQRQPAARKRD